MKISLEWISQFVDIPFDDPERVAHALTMATAETEGVETLRRSTEGKVIAEIVSIDDIPDHPNVKDVEIDAGKKRFRTVCGAPNIKAGMKCVFAPAGARLADGTEIKAADVSGRRSEGVICSPRELGFSDWHESALAAPESTSNGKPLSDLVPALDYIVEVDNKSLTHRPDLWGHYGFARELAAIFGVPLAAYPQADFSACQDLPDYPLKIDDPENCPAYCCVDMRGVAAVASPLDVQWRLHAVGQRTYDILVDLTNYIMFELGQPMHAFDGETLKAVRVARMGKDGSFVTLDGVERRILGDDLMIWDEEKPVALAGVMGGLETEVSKSTTRLLLESANFKGSRIRRTAVRLDLRSEASQRFEKSQPPVNTLVGIGRFVDLLHGAGLEPELLSKPTRGGDLKADPRPIDVSVDFLNRRIGMDIPEDRMAGILTSLGFGVEQEDGVFHLGVPPFRSVADISIPEDIVEEVARVYGFDNIHPDLPDVTLPRAEFNDSLRMEHKARRALSQSHGFVEVHSYSWFDDNWIARLGFEPGKTLNLRNPAAEPNRRMRTTIVPNLLAMTEQNAPQHNDFRIFELGRVYRPKGESDCEERSVLTGVSCGQSKGVDLESHFAEIKGALEDLFASIGGGASRFISGEGAPTPWQSSGTWLSIERDGETIGSMGYVSDSMLEEIAPKGQIVWFELQFDKMDGSIFPEVRHQPASPYPGSWFDVSIIWEAAKGYAPLAETLDRFSNPLVTHRAFLGLYKGKGLPKGMGSYSFRYRIGSHERTLSGEEIEGVQNEFMEFLRGKGLELR